MLALNWVTLLTPGGPGSLRSPRGQDDGQGAGDGPRWELRPTLLSPGAAAAFPAEPGALVQGRTDSQGSGRLGRRPQGTSQRVTWGGGVTWGWG